MSRTREVRRDIRQLLSAVAEAASALSAIYSDAVHALDYPTSVSDDDLADGSWQILSDVWEAVDEQAGNLRAALEGGQ